MRERPFSVICQALTHCANCRDWDGYRQWRRELPEHYAGVPEGGPDFECPEGRPWGWEPGAMDLPAGHVRKCGHVEDCNCSDPRTCRITTAECNDPFRPDCAVRKAATQMRRTR